MTVYNAELLKEQLLSISDTYPEFVRSVLEDCEYYKSKNPNIIEQVIEYISNNPVKASDVIEFTLDCAGLPYSDDNGVWHRWGNVITEEEAKVITQTEYCDN